MVELIKDEQKSEFQKIFDQISKNYKKELEKGLSLNLKAEPYKNPIVIHSDYFSEIIQKCNELIYLPVNPSMSKIKRFNKDLIEEYTNLKSKPQYQYDFLYYFLKIDLPRIRDINIKMYEETSNSSLYYWESEFLYNADKSMIVQLLAQNSALMDFQDWLRLKINELKNRQRVSLEKSKLIASESGKPEKLVDFDAEAVNRIFPCLEKYFLPANKDKLMDLLKGLRIHGTILFESKDKRYLNQNQLVDVIIRLRKISKIKNNYEDLSAWMSEFFQFNCKNGKIIEPRNFNYHTVLNIFKHKEKRPDSNHAICKNNLDY